MGQIKEQALETAESLRVLADMLERRYGAGSDEPQSEAPAEQQQPATFDDFKAAVMQAAKADRNAVVAVLQEHGANRATEVAEQEYVTVISKLQEIT